MQGRNEEEDRKQKLEEKPTDIRVTQVTSKQPNAVARGWLYNSDSHLSEERKISGVLAVAYSAIRAGDYPACSDVLQTLAIYVDLKSDKADRRHVKSWEDACKLKIQSEEIDIARYNNDAKHVKTYTFRDVSKIMLSENDMFILNTIIPHLGTLNELSKEQLPELKTSKAAPEVTEKVKPKEKPVEKGFFGSIFSFKNPTTTVSEAPMFVPPGMNPVSNTPHLYPAENAAVAKGVFTEDLDRISYQEMIDHYNAGLKSLNNDFFLTITEKVYANKDDPKYIYSMDTSWMSVHTVNDKSDERTSIGWKIHIAIDDLEPGNMAKGADIVMAILKKYAVSSFKLAMHPLDNGMQRGKQVTIYYEVDKEKISALRWQEMMSELDRELSANGVKPSSRIRENEQYMGLSKFIAYRNDKGQSGKYIEADDTKSYNPSGAPNPFDGWLTQPKSDRKWQQSALFGVKSAENSQATSEQAQQSSLKLGQRRGPDKP